VSVTAPGGCAWSAQSFADWITVRPPFGSAGSSTVVFDVQPNASGAARSGTLLIAGTQVTVNQNAPRPDLVPDLVPDPILQTSCAAVHSSNGGFEATLVVRNVGSAPAGASQTRIAFDNFGEGPEDIVETRDAPQLPSGGFVTHGVPVPADCWRDEPPSQDSENVTQVCPITMTADHLGQVTEVSEVNNTVTGSCTRTIFRPRILGMIRPSAGR